ncbi:hypothetical protein EV182_004956, partial [Spiromyces aspiralis]
MLSPLLLERDRTAFLNPQMILRDSRATQVTLLLRRKDKLGEALNELMSFFNRLGAGFEIAPTSMNEHVKQNMKECMEAIMQVRARRKLINRCLNLLGRDINGNPLEHFEGERPTQITGDGVVASTMTTTTNAAAAAAPINSNDDSGGNSYDLINQIVQDSEKVAEQVLESLYRHRFLLHSAYVIWTSQVRDIAMRFLYAEDCWHEIRRFLTQTTSKVAHEIVAAKGSDHGDKSHRSHNYTHQFEKYNKLRTDASWDGSGGGGKNTPWASHPDLGGRGGGGSGGGDDGSNSSSSINIGAQPTQTYGRHHRSASQGSRLADNLLFGLLSRKAHKSKPSKDVAAGDDDASTTTTGANEKQQFSTMHDVAKDIENYLPRYRALFELISPQGSLRIDGVKSDDSVVISLERCQVHMIDFLERDPSDSKAAKGPDGILKANPEEREIVKSRTLVELNSMQVFTTERKSFMGYPFYLFDCIYGTRGDVSMYGGTVWPAWIPIEMLLTPRNEIEAVRSKSPKVADDSHCYHKVLDRTSGIINITRANAGYFQGEGASADGGDVNVTTEFSASSP